MGTAVRHSWVPPSVGTGNCGVVVRRGCAHRSGERIRTPICGTKTRCPAVERPRSVGGASHTTIQGSVVARMGSLVKRRRKRMRKKKHKKMLRRTRHQRNSK